MSRFFVSSDAVKGDCIQVSGKEAHHIIDVMRLKPLDKVVTFDGSGKEYVGFIKEIKTKSVTIEIVETKSPHCKETSRITLIQAIPKKDKMDYIVEKSTELGVSRIIPLVTKRTIPDWDDQKRKAAVGRWQKIALEASKQCGRSDIPAIDDIKTVRDIVTVATDYDCALIAALDDRAIRLKDAMSGFGGGKVAIAIGPEGDFTADEIDDVRRAGFKLVNLGSRVLKSDTAGLFVLSILNYELIS